MGTGTSGIPKGPRPSGDGKRISYDEFLKLPEERRYQVLVDIVNDPSITVPSYLDGSVTTKVVYAMGLDGAPKVVDDAQLDAMDGIEVFRGVHDLGDASSITSGDILEQLKAGEHIQLSSDSASMYGRSIYFATNLQEAADFARNGNNPLVARGKIRSSAKMADMHDLVSAMDADEAFNKKTRRGSWSLADNISLFAISGGYDGWIVKRAKDAGGDYAMVLNRRKGLVMSSANKRPSRGSWKQAAMG